jgi:wobble nucleotide-excising tRNase
MKISQISKMKNCRTFHHFVWLPELSEFKDYNLIYGWNGTGKTTIADVLRAIERKQTSFEGEFTVQTDTNAIKSNDLNAQWAERIPPIRVFNRTYIEENIFSTNSGPIAPIFFLGEENVVKQKQVEAKIREQQQKSEKHQTKSAEKDKKERELDALCIRGAKAVKDAILSSGNNPYNTYNKGSFKTKIEALITSGKDAASYNQSDKEKTALKAKFSSSNKDSLIIPTISLPNLGDTRKTAISLLEESLVTEAIDALQNNQTLSAWVQQGLEIHKHEKHKNCQFCLQPLPAERLAALERHFNNAYGLLKSAIANAIGQTTSRIEAIEKIVFPDKAAIFEHLTPNYTNTLRALQNSLKEYTDFLKEIRTALLKKQVQPFEKISFNIAIPNDATSLAQAYISVIKQHNKDSQNYEMAIIDARKKYEEAIVAEYFDEYKSLKNDVDTAKNDFDSLKEDISKLAHDIKELEIAIKEHHKAADQINKDLQDYLGHDELKFQPKDNGYVIHRFGSPAPIKELSEGEKTAIALLYFLKSLEDKNFRPKGIIVIDDPVCSMDDGALFHAFGYIKDKTKDAKQLFILTHNFMFFRQVKNWFNYVNKNNKNKKKDKKEAAFYQTTCSIKSGKRLSNISIVDKLLFTYESEYHYLFKLVYEASLNREATDLSKYYFMPNVARRVLESFLAFRKPSVIGENRLFSMLEAISYNQTKKTKILRFLNVHSHDDSVGTPEHDASILAETPQIMVDLLALIKEEDKKHYDEMMTVIGHIQTAEIIPIPARGA